MLLARFGHYLLAVTTASSPKPQVKANGVMRKQSSVNSRVVIDRANEKETHLTSIMNGAFYCKDICVRECLRDASGHGGVK